MSEERILQAISELGKNLSEQISETNTRIDKLDTKLNNFEEETRDNFALMSSMIRQTNERITKVDKKIDKRYNEIGDLIAGVVTSVDTQFAKIKKVTNY